MAVSLRRSITYRTGSAAPSRLLRRRRPAALSHAPTWCCRAPYLIYIRCPCFTVCIIPAIQYCIIHQALRARRFALRAQRHCAPRSAPAALRGIGATRSRRRGPLGVTQSPSRVSFHTTPRRSPLRLNPDVPSERSRGPPRSSKSRRAVSWQSH